MRHRPWLSRRNVLRGLGVTLALPWLESLAPRVGHAQAGARTKRYVFLYFSNGVARDYWPPQGQGAGASWQLSPIQAPLVDLKSHVSVLSNVGQSELFGGPSVNPSHSQLCAPTLSCTRNDGSQAVLGGPTVDQVIAQHIGGQTQFPSLQLGNSTLDSYPDGQHPAISRSISWAASNQPLYKQVNPQEVFDRLVAQIGPGDGASTESQAQAELRKARDLSVLDYVLEDATSLQNKLSVSDKQRLDQFLSSVRELEGRVKQQVTGGGGGGIVLPERPFAAGVNNEPAGYSRDAHAEVMNDLITLALQTDLTRVITHMLDDARSDYRYHFLKQRIFTAAGSTEVDERIEDYEPEGPTGGLLGLHGLQHAGDSNNGFATVNYWFVNKFKTLLDRLIATPEPDGSGTTLLDSTIVVFMSGMQGSNHNADRLPVMLAGSGGGVFKTDHHHNFGSEVRLADLHLTIMQQGFGLSDVTSFGNSGGTVPDILV